MQDWLSNYTTDRSTIFPNIIERLKGGGLPDQGGKFDQFYGGEMYFLLFLIKLISGDGKKLHV